MNWYVGPWVWDATSADGAFWRAPVGFDGLDLRTLPQQAAAGGAPGVGLFCGQGLLVGSDYTHLGSGSWYDLKPRAKALAALPRRAGFVPRADDLVGALLSLLTDGADPDGSAAPLPLVPTTEGRLELVLGQRHRERFKWGDGGAHADILKAMERRKFREKWEAAGASEAKVAHCRKYLDDLCIRYGVEDWREFVPVAIQGHVGGRLPRETTLTDDFNRSDADPPSNAAAGWSWTEVSGTAWAISSNTMLGNNLTASSIRADSDLSSTDHYCQATCVRAVNVGARYICPMARFSSSANTGYQQRVMGASSGIYKVVAGTETSLSSGTNYPASNASSVVKIECNGSTITGYNAAVQDTQITDTSITTGTRCGLGSNRATGYTADDWSAADLGGGGGGIVYTQLERNMRGAMRGTYYQG